MIGVVKSKRILLFKIIALFFSIFILSFFWACSSSQNNLTNQNQEQKQENIIGMQHYNGYQLKQMTVMGRHHIRSPLTDPDSTLGKLTPNTWHKWSSENGELSVKGGNEEVKVGQYFRKFLESENFIPKNWIPKPDEIYFYANSQQRTIATSNYFAAGLTPIYDVHVVNNYPLNSDDPVFWGSVTKGSEAFKKQVNKEICENFGVESITDIPKKYEKNFQTLENALDFKNSKYAKENNLESLPLDDISLNFEKGKDPTLTGSLKIGNTAADAFKLQYYEEPNDSIASFNKNLTYDQWQQIAELGDVYQRTLFGSHTAAIDKANPMLIALKSYMDNNNRKFTYMGGHDDNIMSLTAALKIKDYSLPYALNKRSPIGANFVISKYVNEKGEEFGIVSLVYETVNQLRNCQEITLDNPLMEYKLEFEGLDKQENGMYKWSDITNRFNESIAEYNNYE